LTIGVRSLTSPRGSPVPNSRLVDAHHIDSGSRSPSPTSGLKDAEADRSSDFGNEIDISSKIAYDHEETRRLKRRKVRTSDDCDIYLFSLPSNPESSPPNCTPSGISITPVSIPPHTTNTLSLKAYVYSLQPPTTSDLMKCVDQYHIRSKVYRDPYYSKERDASENPREYAGLLYHLKGGQGLGVLEEWDHRAGSQRRKVKDKGQTFPILDAAGVGGWEYANSPPSAKEARRWLKSDAAKFPFGDKPSNLRSQVSF
jgi:DNA polymerase zeta